MTIGKGKSSQPDFEMSEKNAAFFDKNADIFERSFVHPQDLFFKKALDHDKVSANATLLDIGGGSGGFAKFLKNCYPNMSIAILDPSTELLKRIGDNSIKCIVGSMPYDINVKETYDYIHMKHVMHHIAGDTIQESKKLFKNSLIIIKSLLKNDGSFLFHDYYYESYIKKSISRDFIFHLLNIQNKFQLKIPAAEFLLNLKVCFYTRDEIKSIFDECGFQIYQIFEENISHKGIKQRALLLENYGAIQIVAKIKED